VGIIRLIVLSIYTSVLGLGVLFIAILFLIYGHKLYHRLKKFEKNNDPTRSRNMKKLNVFARATSITTIVFVVLLGFFLALQFIFKNDAIIFMLSVTFQRMFEFGYCLIVLITHWKSLKTKKSKSGETQTSTTKKSGSSQDMGVTSQSQSQIQSQSQLQP
jgi:anaerobic C4-dicarboxylate transporter